MAEEVAQACGLSLDAAAELLEAVGGDVTTALQIHFDNVEEKEEAAAPAPSTSVAPSAPSSSRPLAPKPAKPVSKAKKRPGEVATLRDFASDDDDDDDETYFAGGKQSGQLVQGNPLSANDRQKALLDIFKRAKQHGAMTDEEFAAQDALNKTGATKKWGRGHRLGDTSEPPREDEGAMDVNPEEEVNEGEGEEPEFREERVIRLWRDGFSVDDGPLRRRDDPAYNDFIQSLARGEVPPEMRQPRMAQDPSMIGRRIIVHVRVEDNVQRDYEPPKKVFQAFGGGGNKLGSPVPEVKSQSDATKSPVNEPANNVKPVAVDESKAITKIQIRLHNGTRMVMNFNHTHTIGDLRSIMKSATVDGPADFEIRQTMPPRVFNDDSVTLAEAKLLQACVVQRPLKN